MYTLALKVTNADGVDVKNINVSSCSRGETTFVFRQRSAACCTSMLDKAITMTCPIGKNVVLAPSKTCY